MGKAKEDCGVEAVTGIDPAVASEVLNDMYFITKIFIIQSQISDKWLRDYYTKLAISSLSIVLHECLQAGLLNKQKSDREAVKLLRTIRHRMVKLVPKGSSDSIKSLMDTMGIDFDHYYFDLQIVLNELNHQELYDIGFTYHDLLKGFEDMEVFNSLIRLPLGIVKDVLTSVAPSERINEIMGVFQKSCSNIAEYVSTKISLHKYPYASGVFFKSPELDRDDKVVILYYYTLVKQGVLLDELIPESAEETLDFFDSMKSKCKFRAVLIENIGLFLKTVNTPLSEKMCAEIDATMHPSFFSLNRSIKNNIHYKRITCLNIDNTQRLYNQQELYLKKVLRIFEDEIKYNIGFAYKFIRFIADRTDATMIEVRKKNPERRNLEDVSIDEWEAARERLHRKKD